MQNGPSIYSRVAPSSLMTRDPARRVLRARRLVTGLVLACALVSSIEAAAAQEAAAPRDASLLLYLLPHAEAPPPASDRLPFTIVDGVEAASAAPEGRPESALAHFRELQRLAGLRRAVGAPVTLALEATREGEAYDARILAEGDAPAGATLELVVFGEGHLALGRAEAVALAAGREIRATLPADERARGVVAIARGADGEALQSATWVEGGTPTRSVSKRVLVEHVSAKGCAPCVPATEAFQLFAAQSGALDATGGSEASLLRAPSSHLVAGALGGALAGLVVLRRLRA